jgi:hypothetical protein
MHNQYHLKKYIKICKEKSNIKFLLQKALIFTNIFSSQKHQKKIHYIKNMIFFSPPLECGSRVI